MLKKIFALILIMTSSLAVYLRADEVVVSLISDKTGDVVASEIVKFPQMERDELFCRMLSVARADLTGENDLLEKTDFGNREISFVKTIENGRGGNKLIDKEKASFRFTVTMTPDASGNLYVRVNDMWVTYKDKGLFQKTVAASNLKADNQRQSDLKRELANLISYYLTEYTTAIKSAPYKKVTHWKELAAGKVVKGMTGAEVELLMGEPRNITKSSTKEKWMYSNDSVVIFINGVVSNVIY